jgi:outer membrane protein assembly factor BamB
MVGDVVLCGFDNGKVLAVNGNDGATQWEATVTPPHGRTELERLSDIDSTVWVQGQNVYAVGFQGRVAMLALDTGQIWWAHDMSSYRGLSADGENLFVTQSDGAVVALHDRDGSELWRNEDIKRRGLSAPVETSTAVAVADYQGYVHWLDKKTGYLVARVRVSKSRVSNPPVAVDDTVVVMDDDGKMAAFRADPAHAGTAVPAPKPLPTQEQKKAAKAAAKEAAKAAKAAAKTADKAPAKPAAPPPVVAPPSAPPAAPAAPPTQP